MPNNSELTIRPNHALALAGDQRNPFEVVGDAIGGKKIVGELLKFTKGRWVAGQNEDELPTGTKLIAAMPEARLGWVNWKGRKVVETRMGRTIDGFVPEPRSALGDDDPSQWEKTMDGVPQDPWSLTSSLILKAPGGGLYTWNAASRGGHNAYGELCRLFGRHLRSGRSDQLPLVSLEADHYKHAQYGRVFIPVLRFAGWTDANEVLEALGLPRQDRQEALAPTIALDDDIPF